MLFGGPAEVFGQVADLQRAEFAPPERASEPSASSTRSRRPIMLSGHSPTICISTSAVAGAFPAPAVPMVPPDPAQHDLHALLVGRRLVAGNLIDQSTTSTARSYLAALNERIDLDDVRGAGPERLASRERRAEPEKRITAPTDTAAPRPVFAHRGFIYRWIEGLIAHAASKTLAADQAAVATRKASSMLVQAKWAIPSIVGEQSSTSSARSGRGSMTAETTTARNNAPTAISNASIGLLTPFSPLGCGADGKRRAEPR